MIAPEYIEDAIRTCLSGLPPQYRDLAERALRQESSAPSDVGIEYPLPDGERLRAEWVRRPAVLQHDTVYWLCSVIIIKHVARGAGAERSLR